jgi:hypothetical protein
MESLPFTAEDAAGMVGMLFGSLLVGYLGYRIRFRRDVGLIAGYDPETGADDGAMARLVGNLAVGTALLTALYGLAVPFVGSSLPFWGSYVVAVVAGVVFVQVRGRRYAGG